jgi:hypothetical protein
MHVHLDARHLDAKAVKAIGAKFKKVLPVMGKMVPESRRENSFCRLDVSGLTGSRYFAVNLTAFKKYRTVEIRLHSSTTDFNKIIQWATLLSCVFKAEKIKAVCHDLNTLTEYVRLPEETLEYLTQRIDLFSGGSTPARFADNDSTQNAEAV